MPGHRCKKLFQLEIVADEGEAQEHDESGDESEQLAQTGTPIESSLANITLETMLGVPTKETFKFSALLYGSTITVMIDSGASHNFICSQVVEQLHIPILTAMSFGVKLGNGKAVKGQGICQKLLLQFQGMSIIQDFLLFPLGSVDVILGVEWLQSMGWTATHYGIYVMALWDGHRFHWIKGDRSLVKGDRSLIAIHRYSQSHGGRATTEKHSRGRATHRMGGGISTGVCSNCIATTTPHDRPCDLFDIRDRAYQPPTLSVFPFPEE